MSDSKRFMSFKEGFDSGVKRFVDECAQCGQCLEECPVFSEPKFELIKEGPSAVIGKVMELLKGGSSSAEAYKMAYGCVLGCSFKCKSACPQGLEVQQAFMAAGHRLRTAGVGSPPLVYHHMPGHRYSFGHVFGDLQMKESEVPWLKEAPSDPEAVDVVLFVSCIARGIPHLALEAMDILTKMKVKFVAIEGGCNLCCGANAFFTVGMEETGKVSEKYISTLAKFRPKKVVSLCAACAFMGDTILPALFSVPFEAFHITEFLADNLDKLPFTKPLNKVVTIHDSCSQRNRGKWDMPRKLLQAIPGVTLVEMEHSKENNLCCAIVPTANFPGSMDAYHSARLDEAKAAGADVMTTICASCHCVFSGFENQYPFEIKHAITLVAEAMDIHHEDKLKKYLLTGDVDKVLDEARDYVEASDLSLLEFKHVLPGYFETLCGSRGLASK